MTKRRTAPIVHSIVHNPAYQVVQRAEDTTSLPSVSTAFGMSFVAQLNHLQTALRHTRARMLAPLDQRQLQLPTDPEVYVEDVLHYVMDEVGRDLRTMGHVLAEDMSFKDEVNHYPLYHLHLAGGDAVLHRMPALRRHHVGRGIGRAVAQRG